MFEREIKEYGKSIGIDLIGFTTAEPFEKLKEYLLERKEKGYLSGFEERDITKRCTPTLLMENAKSIIAIGVSYYIGKQEFSHKDYELLGKISKTAWGTDYHIILQEKMEKLVEFIKQYYPEIQYKISVDTGPLVDREVARRAGLGDYGKNNLLIHPLYGSYLFLGNILTNIEFTSDQPITIDCKECSKCISACPPKSLLEPYVMDAKRCISYNTQRKDEIPLEIRKKMKNQIYGCDICQEVCPFNKKALVTSCKDFIPKDISPQPNLEWIMKISNKEFNEKFLRTSAGWRGKKIIQRNAIIAIGNLKMQKGISILKEAIKDGRKEIRQYAAWALGQIECFSCICILEEALPCEKEEEVKAEIILSLEIYKNLRKRER